MILEVTIGESICIRMDDEMTDQRPTPEQVEDYLTRMSRTAVKTYVDLPTPSHAQPGDDSED